MTCELTVVIPTYNERDNIDYCISLLEGALADVDWELMFVDDDSTDGTAEYVRELSRKNPKIRCIQRLGRRGLSSACIEGILATSSPYICIMDADMQHDEKLIPELLNRSKVNNLDLVIGSRYMEQGSTGELSRGRVLISRIATNIGKFLLKKPVTDPMSGFFLLRRSFFESVMRDLSGKGFKILLDLLVSPKKDFSYEEMAYVMRERKHGVSKLDYKVVWEFFVLMIDKILGRILPMRFIMFALVGLSGVVVSLLVVSLLYRFVNVDFSWSQGIATYVAMTSNYILNNSFTYREIRLRGMQFFRGLLSFYLACTFGALVNVALAKFLYEKNVAWWISSLSGALAGAIWNYAITAVFTWRVEIQPGSDK